MKRKRAKYNYVSTYKRIQKPHQPISCLLGYLCVKSYTLRHLVSMLRTRHQNKEKRQPTFSKVYKKLNAAASRFFLP